MSLAVENWKIGNRENIMKSQHESRLQISTKPNWTEVLGFKFKEKGVYQHERKWCTLFTSMNAESLLFSPEMGKKGTPEHMQAKFGFSPPR
jgi:hypothetical protein